MSFTAHYFDGITSDVFAIWSSNSKEKLRCTYIPKYEGLVPNEKRVGTRTLAYIDFHTGSHLSKLSKLENNQVEAMFFKKRGRYWWLIGKVRHAFNRAEISDSLTHFGISIDPLYNDLGFGTSLTVLDTLNMGIRLATNKIDSLKMLGFEKKKTKGSGNLNHGVCNVVYVSEQQKFVDATGIWTMADSKTRVDANGFKDGRLWWDEFNQEVWYLEGSKVIVHDWLKKDGTFPTTTVAAIKNWYGYEKPDFD
jgi:hypothetical protein